MFIHFLSDLASIHSFRGPGPAPQGQAPRVSGWAVLPLRGVTTLGGAGLCGPLKLLVAHLRDLHELTFGVLVTERRCPHVTQANGPLAAAVDEGVAVLRVELGGCDHLCQLLHIGWFNVHNIWRGLGKELNGNACLLKKNKKNATIRTKPPP